MKKWLISAIALVATISQASFAQMPTPEQLAQRSIERRADSRSEAPAVARGTRRREDCD